jgi:hypothetical protein
MLAKCAGFITAYLGPTEFAPMLFQATIVCLIVLSVGVLVAHAVDALRT